MTNSTYGAYIIFDKVTEEFNFPFFQKNDAAAKRAILNNKDNVNDLLLYKIGEYDFMLGKLTSLDEPIKTWEYSSSEAKTEEYSSSEAKTEE